MTDHRQRPSAALLVATLALVVSLGGTTYAATGGTFLLGKSNSADKTTKLKTSGSFDKTTLEVKNSGDGPAATFKTSAGQPPFAVTQNGTVTNLSADLLDGVSSGSFQRTDATPLTAIVSSQFAQTTSTATGLLLTPNLEQLDPSNMHAPGSSSLLTAPVSGTYVVTAEVEWENTGSGYRSAALVGPTFLDQRLVTGGANDTRQNPTAIVHLQAGQGMQVLALQGSGGNLNVQLKNFAMTWVGP